MAESLIEGVGISVWGKAVRLARRRHWPVPVGNVSPPSCPPGWHTGPPDFVGVGAQRAGTSWWFRQIARHPQVESIPHMPKELHYFDQFWWKHFEPASVSEYHEFFPRHPGRLTGEWTPKYMHDPWTAPLLRTAAPNAKLLAILRDPVDRYVSGIAFDLARGAPAHPIVASEAFTRGLYARQLLNLTKHFDRSQVLVLQYERCVVDTEEQLKRTLGFLGVDPEQAPNEGIKEVSNPTYIRKPRLTDLERTGLIDAYEDDVRSLMGAFPNIDVSLWANFSHLRRSAVEGSARAG